ncbi:MAG: cytochrome c biogenesis protein transmembrane region [Candidatus Rokubacteria bacterium CSP1-6]|nr:MAG: cytochrome c biogenesis protein transmembrane region [Candidatus Rokubacteria bacterium CSP1-6]
MSNPSFARPGRILAFSGAAVGLLGLAVLAGLGAPAAPSAAMTARLPALTLGTVLVAGIADGFNPCAFTVLLLFITSLVAAAQARDAPSAVSLRGRVIGLGSIYIASVFFTYLALGVGLLAAVDLFTQRHLPARLGAVLSIALGLWMLKDYFLPEMGLRLEAPAAVGRWARASARRATIPTLVAGGVLIGLCTLPCSGAVYLAVLSLLAAQSSALAGFGYLVLYNALFVLPLVGILLLASARPALNRLAHWNLHHREWVRLGLGTGVVLMGFVILATV